MRFTVLASAVLLSACVGQSGSEVIPPITKPDPNPMVPSGGIPPQPHCPCDGLRERQQVRATVLEVESFETITNLRRYTMRAEEILSDTQRGEESLRPGDRFGGYWTGMLACGGETERDLAAGTEVLAFYQRGWQDGALCCEYITCSDDCPRDQDSNDGNPANSPQERCYTQCRTQTADACAEHREEALMHGDVMLIPWGDALVVGHSEHGTATIAQADLPALTLDRDACMAALDDRYDALHPQEAPRPSMRDADPDAPPGQPEPEPEPTPPAPMMPSAMPLPPAPSATPPQGAATPPVNPASPPGPPPAHPEEIRVRCQ